MPARRRLLAAAVTAATCLGAQALSYATATASDASATETVVSRGVEIPAFYTPPTTLPTTDGAVIRTEPLPSPSPSPPSTAPSRAGRPA